ncbi:MAG: RnfABCDGE type electron transport complex subunit A [Lentisphaerota bacterium]|jgi:electron transport complex protein RnfA
MNSEILSITIGAILVNNFVLSKFLGICPFLGVSKRLDTALGMSGAVIFVMAIASFFTSLVFRYLFSGPVSIGPFKDMNLGFLQILLFIVIIAALVQIVELMMQKLSPALYKSLGIYLPLITTNCAVLGAVTINANEARGIIGSTIFGTCSGIGFAVAIILFASLREKIELANVPPIFRGTAIALITAGILAMAFMGFSGLVK